MLGGVRGDGSAMSPLSDDLIIGTDPDAYEGTLSDIAACWAILRGLTHGVFR